MRRKEYCRKYLETRKRESEKKGKEKQIVFCFFVFFGAKNKSAFSEIGIFLDAQKFLCQCPRPKRKFSKRV